MEKPDNNIIIENIEPENITLIDNLDLNALFNLTYNFDLLKGTISTILKNQESLKNQIENEKRKNNDQNRTIESLKSNMLLIKEKYMSKELFSATKYQIDDINIKIIQLGEKINHMEEEMSKSK